MNKKVDRNYLEIYSLDDLIESNSPSSEFKIELIDPPNFQLNKFFYKKELKFQVSSSYGPGRYDKNYEEKGHDYPISYVRWTENRNFQAILKLLELKKLI